MSANASRRAAQTQAGSADRAAQLQAENYQQTRADLMPWMQAGRASLADLSRGLGLDGAGGIPGVSGAGGTGPLTPEQVQQIYQRYMGRSVLSEEMQSLLAGNQTAEQLERAVAQSPEHQQHVQIQGNVAPVDVPLFIGQGQQGAGIAGGADLGGFGAPGGLLKPFSLSDFQQSPAYQFNLEQGLDAITKGARARRMNYAPATLMDIGRFSQGLASNEFTNAYNMYNQDQGNIYNRLFGMSGAGQNAAAGIGGFGAGAAGASGDAMMQGANARAAGIIGQSNAYSGAINNAMTYYQQQQLLKSLQQPTYGGTAPTSAPPSWAG